MEETRDIPAEELSALRNPATRRGAFDRLVGAYLRPLYWHARRLVVVHEDAEDVVQENKGLTKEEKEELMAPVGAEPDPDFNTAMTFEEMNNVVEVLTSATRDEQKAFRASMTIYHKLSGTEILNLLENEIGCQHKIGHLLNEYLDEAGNPLLRRRGTPKKKEVFDIGKFV